jgi:multiple sugar transport system substrate-binding protein
MPKGPAGQYHLNTPFQHGILKHSKNQKLAKDFLKWLHQDANYGKWFEVEEGYSGPPRWEEPDGARSTSRCGHAPGDPHEPDLRLSRAGLGQATESYTKYVVVDMYAKAVQGMKAEDAVKWAEGELKKIYED